MTFYGLKPKPKGQNVKKFCRKEPYKVFFFINKKHNSYQAYDKRKEKKEGDKNENENNKANKQRSGEGIES